MDSSRKRRRSWYSLLGTAITYVWPDSVVLQLRAFACIAIILIMRVLNLAVPILYKKVVDTLAATSEGTHPRPGDEREHFQFWQVRGQCCSAVQFYLFFKSGQDGCAGFWPYRDDSATSCLKVQHTCASILLLLEVCMPACQMACCGALSSGRTYCICDCHCVLKMLTQASLAACHPYVQVCLM